MLGKNFRDMRHERGLTLSELSESTGLTPSYLSQIERDIIEPSLSSMRKIAAAYNIPIYRFFDEETTEHAIIKKNERKKLDLPNSSITYEFLTPMVFENNSKINIELIYYQLCPVSWSSDDFIIHDADECIFIIEGEIELYLGEEKYEVNEGDSIYIRKNTPHRFFNPSKDSKVIGISAISPPIY